MICKKAEISERKYRPDISDTFLRNSYEQVSLKKGVGGNLGNSNSGIKQFQRA